MLPWEAPPWPAERAQRVSRGASETFQHVRSSSPRVVGTPASYSGYRSKEGYSGFHPRKDVSNIRSSVDQMRSSEALNPPSARTSRSSQTRPGSAYVTRFQAPVGFVASSALHQSKPAHYEHLAAVEGYAGHRPRTPATDNLGSGQYSWVHADPRVGSPGKLLNSAHRIRVQQSNQRGFFAH